MHGYGYTIHQRLYSTKTTVCFCRKHLTMLDSLTSASCASSARHASSNCCGKATRSASSCGPSCSRSRRCPTYVSSWQCSSSYTPSSACRWERERESGSFIHFNELDERSAAAAVSNYPLNVPLLLLFKNSAEKVFGGMAFNPDTEYNRHNHFQSFIPGLLVLFRWVWCTPPPYLAWKVIVSHHISVPNNAQLLCLCLM